LAPRTPARAPDREGRVPRVRGDAPELRMRVSRAGELRRGRPRVDDGAGAQDPLGDRRRPGRDLVDRERAEAHPPALDLQLLFEGDRQPLERTDALTARVPTR